MKFKVITKKKKNNQRCFALQILLDIICRLTSILWFEFEQRKNPRNNIDNSTIKTQRVASLYI